ncbi:GNAT family N-acetyltransferase [Actinospica durhamensis]|uniref:GNAT family N-acetyltransferase n=1 Tax=Actinospica durhamensis TaxID=1508375 RepID=A0A941ILG6_9ACTN|nr:GNAT family N-acetyltransferase [Actinospica durhamensis]MBR7831704.1 GNAT family N-acetyltransferase [Actinospica durhamensis]
MPTIETPRLILRVPKHDDIEAFDEMDADPEVMRWIGDGRVHERTKERSAGLIDRVRSGWEERGYGLIAATARESGEVLGWVTLAAPDFLPEVLPAVEIGWRFRRRHWGRGYATEAARPMLHYAFTEVGLDRVLSLPRVENAASRRVMEKLGLGYTRETVVPGNGTTVAIYALDRARYLE